MKDIKYRLKNGKFVSINPDIRNRMSYKELSKAFEGKVVSLEDLAKTVGIKKPKAEPKKRAED